MTSSEAQRSTTPALWLLLACFLGSLALAGCKSDGPLSVNRIDPVEGDSNGGSLIHIYGNRFTKDGARSAKIYFGSRQASPPRFLSDTEMLVEVPSGKTGDTVDLLIIFEPGGEKKFPRAFTYVEHKKATIDDISTRRPPAK